MAWITATEDTEGQSTDLHVFTAVFVSVRRISKRVDREDDEIWMKLNAYFSVRWKTRHLVYSTAPKESLHPLRGNETCDYYIAIS